VADTDVHEAPDASTAYVFRERGSAKRIPAARIPPTAGRPLKAPAVAVATTSSTLAYVSPATISDAIQHYLREIYKLGASGERVSTTAIARQMGVSAASASAMVKKLAALSLVAHAPYRGVSLTAEGEQIALEVIRHHRLLELYLAETLGIHVDEVHDEADRLEHGLSEELEARIDEALGFPTHDPHGDPIPDANLEWPEESSLRDDSS